MRDFLKKYIGILILSLLLYSNCKNGLYSDSNQGVIHYQLNYLDSEKENPIIALLPRTMDLKFKNRKLSNELTGDMGLFAIRFVINGIDSSTTTLIRVLDKKYRYKAKIFESIPGYNMQKNLKIEYDSSFNIQIAGIDCHRVKVSFTDQKNEQKHLSMYYAKDISIPFANAYNPYSTIPEILLNFQVKFNGINMEFIAQGIEYKDIEDKEFSIPDGYEEVDREGIERVMQKYLPQK